VTNSLEKNVRATFWNQEWFLSLLLVAVVLIAYQPAGNGTPVWDDEQHLTNPELYSTNGLLRIWTQPGVTQQYYPLVHSLFWVEYKLWEYKPAGYHLLNILLHAGSALLLFRILRKLEFSAVWLAAAIFAFHPVEVESVAWISELKNALSGIFYLGSALTYLNYDQQKRKTLYFAALGLFVMGLLSKTVVASMPAALLVVFWWKRGRLSWKQDVLPLIPFFTVGIVSGIFTAWVEKKYIGATGSDFNFSLVDRMLIAGRAFWFYLEKIFWPVDLIFIYPRWDVSASVWWQYLFPVFALQLLALLWILRRRARGPLAAMLFFSGTLFPALGFFNIYPFRFSFVADHFQYLASIGPIALAAAGIMKIPADFLKKGVCGILLGTLVVLTWRQSGMYASNETLWLMTVAKNPGSWMAHDNLGVALLGNGKVDEAVNETRVALALRPDSAETYSNLANALLQGGRVDEAVENYNKSLDINPGNQASHYNLGNVLLFQKQDVDGAIPHLEKCIGLEREMGRPENVYAHYDLGVAYSRKGQFQEAVVHFQKAVELVPQFGEAQERLAWILATCGDQRVGKGWQGLISLGKLNDLAGGRDPRILKIMAAVYANAGQFKEAVETAQQALTIATAMHDDAQIEALEGQLELYKAGKPFRDTTGAP